jgi:hypothetical protein
MFDLKFALTMLYNLGAMRIPGLAALVPLDALMAIAEAVESGIEHKLKLDFIKIEKPEDILKQPFRLLQALGALYLAAINYGGAEQVGKIYDLLKLLTNIEDYKTREQFIRESEPAIPMLPAANAAPTEPVEEGSILIANGTGSMPVVQAPAVVV